MASIERKKMDNALKQVVIPTLREQGFKGSLPHFRRINENNIDLITFQFNKWGGSFVVELASCSKEDTPVIRGEKLPPNKVTAHFINDRFRLGSESLEEDGIWFNFESVKCDQDYIEVANSVLNLLHTSDKAWIISLYK